MGHPSYVNSSLSSSSSSSSTSSFLSSSSCSSCAADWDQHNGCLWLAHFASNSGSKVVAALYNSTLFVFVFALLSLFHLIYNSTLFPLLSLCHLIYTCKLFLFFFLSFNHATLLWWMIHTFHLIYFSNVVAPLHSATLFMWCPFFLAGCPSTPFIHHIIGRMCNFNHATLVSGDTYWFTCSNWFTWFGQFTHICNILHIYVFDVQYIVHFTLYTVLLKRPGAAEPQRKPNWIFCQTAAAATLFDLIKTSILIHWKI